MSFLCLDSDFKEELGGIKIIDLMTWLGLRIYGCSHRSLAYCATPNAKYNLSPWIEQMGKRDFELPSFIHPVIPEHHDLMLIQNVSEWYWHQKQKLYHDFWDQAEWLGEDPLPGQDEFFRRSA
jgi:hypothetical protein